MKRLLLVTAAMILSAGMASAAVTAEQLVASYQAQGYTTIEITTGVSQIKVEAVLDLTKVEVVYDIASGAILSQEQSAADATDANQGVEIAVSGQDFLGTNGAGVIPVAGDATEDVGDDNGSDNGSGDNASEDGSGAEQGDDSGETESETDGGED